MSDVFQSHSVLGVRFLNTDQVQDWSEIHLVYIISILIKNYYPIRLFIIIFVSKSTTTLIKK